MRWTATASQVWGELRSRQAKQMGENWIPLGCLSYQEGLSTEVTANVKADGKEMITLGSNHLVENAVTDPGGPPRWWASAEGSYWAGPEFRNWKQGRWDGLYDSTSGSGALAADSEGSSVDAENASFLQHGNLMPTFGVLDDWLYFWCVS